MGLSEIGLSERSQKFAREVGSVVLGVVIALSLGEIVESINWANRRSDAQAALQVELTHAAANASERHRISGCLERRLAQVAQVIDQGASTGRLPHVRNVSQPPMRPWRSTAWETVVASQTASRFPVPTLNELASAYQTIEQIRSWNIDEKEAWTSLSILEGPGRPLTPQLETYLRDAHAKAKYYARIIPITTRQLTRDIRQAGMEIQARPNRGRQRAAPTQPENPRQVCVPMLILPA